MSNKSSLGVRALAGLALIVGLSGCATQQGAQRNLGNTPAIPSAEANSLYMQRLTRGMSSLTTEELAYVHQKGGITNIRGLECPHFVQSENFRTYMVSDFVRQSKEFDARYTSAQN